MADFDIEFAEALPMNVEFNTHSFDCDFGVGIPQSDYSGAYEVTPSAEEQVLPTANKTLEGNITVNPIPNNYGKIIWDGTTLTVE